MSAKKFLEQIQFFFGFSELKYINLNQEKNIHEKIYSQNPKVVDDHDDDDDVDGDGEW